MSAILQYVSFGMCLLALLFFVIGCIGFSNDHDVIENVSWIMIDTGPTTIYYGLKEATTSSGGGGSYEDCKDVSDMCDQCNDDGKGAFALIFIATLITAAAAGLTGFLSQATEANMTMGTINIVLACLAVGASLISLAIFMGGCYNEIDDNTNEDLEWGPGAALSIIGLLIMAAVAVIQILVTCVWKPAA